jgi:hypothetical protein
MTPLKHLIIIIIIIIVITHLTDRVLLAVKIITWYDSSDLKLGGNPGKMVEITNLSSVFVLTEVVCLFVCLFVSGLTASQWAMTSSFPKFMNHTRRTTFGRTPLDE